MMGQILTRCLPCTRPYAAAVTRVIETPVARAPWQTTGSRRLWKMSREEGG